MEPVLRPRIPLGDARVEIERRPDGAILARSPQPLAPHARAVGDWLLRWAREAPDRTFLAERRGDDWQRLTYADALAQARRIGQALLERDLGPERPLAILSENSIEHALVALGAMHVGVPIVPISPAYALMSQDLAKLRAILALVRPGLVFVADSTRYARAIEALALDPVPLPVLLESAATDAVERAHARVGPDTVAKILFTSGSTGAPKGVINTHRMLTANQQQSLHVWPFVRDTPPVVVDWLPWNHTFGGNYNFDLVLSNGGTMYIDAGKPVPGLVETTVRNLKSVEPTMYFNVPQGFALLLPYLEQDAALRRSFFARCEFVFYAAAALPQTLWQRFERLALAERDGRIALVSAWGSTETAPLATAVHYPVERAGLIGLPVPGCELKLVPSGDKLEARVRGPNVTPGYFGRPDLTRDAFDDEGYYRMGDALRFDDPQRPGRGFVFDGRVAEDFKLSSGTWVHVGALRLALIDAAQGLVQDAVIAGHDRAEAAALVFLNAAAAAALSDAERRERLAAALARLSRANRDAASMRIARALVLADPPNLDAGEITDKGYINQRAVLQARAHLVEALYAERPGSDVVVCE